jgi:hypothetical protein
MQLNFKNAPNFYDIQKRHDKRIYAEMPNVNLFDPNLPIHFYLLSIVDNIQVTRILWGKDFFNTKDGSLDYREASYRQYEFQLNKEKADEYGILHLYIKDKNKWFKNQEDFKYMHGRMWQKIPITYRTLSRMTEDELSIIYFDFD